jgi:hypothetical protein
MQKHSPKRRPTALPFIFLLSMTICLALVAPIPQGRPAKSVCVNNLRQIDGAKEEWALENRAPVGSIVLMEQITPFMKGGEPRCSSGGVYVVGRIGEAPHCSIREHVLDSPPPHMSPSQWLFVALAAISGLLTLMALRSMRRNSRISIDPGTITDYQARTICRSVGRL